MARPPPKPVRQRGTGSDPGGFEHFAVRQRRASFAGNVSHRMTPPSNAALALERTQDGLRKYPVDRGVDHHLSPLRSPGEKPDRSKGERQRERDVHSANA